ncbi:MAG: hypothetical protein KAR05_03780 [Candidatus Omnitrophica bacterium]|nr:hypothetical protein [Candidatus Omnitrophota bacterium]
MALENNVLREFLRQFRICYANASTYAEGHQIFLKSIATLKQKLTPLFAAQSQLEIFIAPRYLQINEQKLEGDILYEAVAQFLHHRNMKSIKLFLPVTEDELNHFFTKAGRKPRDILKEGGLMPLLKEKPLPHLAVEMLDYSQILKSTKEDKDVWLFLLRDAVEGDDNTKVDAVIEYFGNMVQEVGAQDVLEEGEMRENIEQFLNYLQKKKKKAHSRCVKIFFKSFLDFTAEQKHLDIPPGYKSHIKTLSKDDLAEILLDELLAEEKKEGFIFDLFDQVITPQEHADVATFLTRRILRCPSQNINEEWLDGTIDSLQDLQNATVLENYIQPLKFIRDQIAQEMSFYFNEQLMPINFRSVLINLISVEKGKQDLALMTELILKEGDQLSDKDKSPFYQMLIEVLNRRDDKEKLNEVFDAIYRNIGNYVESAILQGIEITEFESYLPYLKVSTINPEEYLDKIFDPDNEPVELLTLFFKFFPSNSFMFCERLQPHLNDTKYILEWVERFRSFTAPAVLSVLKFIYSKMNIYVKIEVMKVMENLEFFDDDFLLSIVKEKSDNIILKETALRILLRGSHFKHPVLDALFEVYNLFGNKNALLLENIAFVHKFDLKDARENLVMLTKSIAIWSVPVREAADKVLKEWGYGDY